MRVEINTVAHAGNIRDLPKMRRMLAEWGVDEWQIHEFQAIGSLAKTNASTFLLPPWTFDRTIRFLRNMKGQGPRIVGKSRFAQDGAYVLMRDNGDVDIPFDMTGWHERKLGNIRKNPVEVAASMNEYWLLNGRAKASEMRRRRTTELDRAVATAGVSARPVRRVLKSARSFEAAKDVVEGAEAGLSKASVVDRAVFRATRARLAADVHRHASDLTKLFAAGTPAQELHDMAQSLGSDSNSTAPIVRRLSTESSVLPVVDGYLDAAQNHQATALMTDLKSASFQGNLRFGRSDPTILDPKSHGYAYWDMEAVLVRRTPKGGFWCRRSPSGDLDVERFGVFRRESPHQALQRHLRTTGRSLSEVDVGLEPSHVVLDGNVSGRKVAFAVFVDREPATGATAAGWNDADWQLVRGDEADLRRSSPHIGAIFDAIWRQRAIAVRPLSPSDVAIGNEQTPIARRVDVSVVLRSPDGGYYVEERPDFMAVGPGMLGHMAGDVRNGELPSRTGRRKTRQEYGVQLPPGFMGRPRSVMYDPNNDPHLRIDLSVNVPFDAEDLRPADKTMHPGGWHSFSERGIERRTDVLDFMPHLFETRHQETPIRSIGLSV
jgi:hypothetical protein